MHPRQMIVRGINRWRIWRMTELLTISAWQRPKIIIEGVIFFYDDHYVLDGHSNLPARSGLRLENAPPRFEFGNRHGLSWASARITPIP